MTNLIAENQSCSIVSNSKNETAKQSPKKENNTRNNNETKSLKSLAIAILLENAERNNCETSIKKSETKPYKENAFCFTHLPLRTDMKCRRCFDWKPSSSSKNSSGICRRTQEVKAHNTYCVAYNDTVGGAYAQSRRH